MYIKNVDLLKMFWGIYKMLIKHLKIDTDVFQMVEDVFHKYPEINLNVF